MKALVPEHTEVGDAAQPAGSSAPPSVPGHNDGRQDELTSEINADLTLFPSGCYPPGAPTKWERSEHLDAER